MQTARKNWRKLVKKLRRKRKRQLAAKARDVKLEQEEVARQNDPAFQRWMQQQAALELCERQSAEARHQEEEEAWLRRELLAQQQFRIDKMRQAEAEAEVVALRLKQEAEFAAIEAEKRKRHEDKARQAAAALEEFENAMKLMEAYLENAQCTEPPSALRRLVESKPSAKACEFYERTNCCRFGMSCIYNHRRPLLSCIIIVRHFFRHPLLQDSHENEYANADAQLELSERDLRDDYDEFFNDVVPELEKFGDIINFRTTRNVLAHLRGHVFVEYTQEKAALKAFVNLQGRYYASKRLNVEFSSFKSWRGAVCGLSFTRKCPKAQNCNYLHLFRNPDNKYNTMLERTPKTSSRSLTAPTAKLQTPLLSWNDIKCANGKDNPRNWRWSESPEVELSTETLRQCTNSRLKSGGSASDLALMSAANENQSETDSKLCATDETPEKTKKIARNAQKDKHNSNSALKSDKYSYKSRGTSEQSTASGLQTNADETSYHKRLKLKRSKAKTKESTSPPHKRKKHKKDSETYSKRITKQ